MEDNKKKVATASTDAAVDGKAKGAPLHKSTSKRDHEEMSSASSAAVAPSVTPAAAVSEKTEEKKPSLFQCPMSCPHVFSTEKALFVHMRKHPGRTWRGINPPTEAQSSSHGAGAGAGNGDDESAGGERKKMKKGLPFDLNELPPPEEEEEDDAAKKKNN